MTEPTGESSVWASLERHIAWAEGPWFVFVFGAGGVAALRERALALVRTDGGAPRVLQPKTPQALREQVAELVHGAPHPLIWLEALPDTPPWLEAWDDVLLRLNERREVLRRTLGGGLVIAAAPSLKARFREAAPDLWSVRSLVLEVDDPSSGDPMPHTPDPRAARANNWRIAEALLRVGFHLRMQRQCWFALISGDDPAPRRRMLEALTSRYRVLVHSGWSEALTTPTDADLHWLDLDDDPPLGLLAALQDESLSRPLLLAGSRSLEAALGAVAGLSSRAFLTRLYVERSLRPGPLPVLAVQEASLRDAWSALARARSLEDDLAALDGEAEQEVWRARADHLVAAAEALLLQGWSTEAAPVVEELRVHVGPVDPARASSVERAALARTEELAGQVARAAGDLPTARERQRVAIDLRARLATTAGPERHQRRSEWARALSVAGELAVAAGDLDDAEPRLRQALDVRRELASWSDDHETRAELATGWSLLGDLELARSVHQPERLEHAREALEEALRVRQHLATETGLARHRRLLSVSWGRMGRVHARAGDTGAARRAFERAAELARALVDEDPGRPALRMEATVAESLAGDAARAAGDWHAARVAWARVVEERRSLVAQDPENARWQQLLAVALGRRADAELTLGDLAAARQAAREAVEVSEQLAWMDPSHVAWQRGLALAWIRRGDVAHARERPQRAAAAWRRAEAVLQALESLPQPEATRRATEIRAALVTRGTLPDVE